jgi:type I restriction enzyme S subunit
VDSGVRFVKIESLSGSSVDCSKTVYITEECNTSFFRSQLKENDILFSIAGALGVIALVDRRILPANVNQAIGIVRLKQGYSHPFLLQQLKGELIQAEIQRIRAGAAQPNISLSQLGDFAALLPGKAEQQKIADCLSSVDELIAAQTRKVNALKTHKQGLMQQLFPREGETHPRIRFPEFQNAGEWVSEPLGELAIYENGKAYEKNIAEVGKYIVVNSRFISTDGAVQKYTNADYLIAKAGEVLMVLSDLPKGRALAKCYFVEANDRYAVNQRVCRLKPKQIDGKFLYYALNRHPRLLAFDDGLNQTHLSKGSVTECPLCVPVENAEQQRIATCLSSLDALIAAETQKLVALKTHKKGLMQQLFPSPEAATA